MVAPRIELSTTRLSAGYGQPARDYLGHRLTTVAMHLTPSLQSGTSESNREPPAPKAGVLPSAPLPESFSSDQRSTTVFAQWTSWESNPEALIASQSADPSASPITPVDWEVLESSSTVLQTAAKPSQLPVQASRCLLAPLLLSPPQQKKARCSWGEGTPGQPT